jgi:exonuclease III
LSGVNLEFLDVGAFIEGKYSLQLNLWDKKMKEKWNFINIYGPAHEEDRQEFLSELSGTISRSKEPVILGGDFNIIRFSSEKTNQGYTNTLGSSILPLILMN